MFSWLKRGIAKIIAWGIRKVGGGIPEIKEKLLDYGIYISEKPIQENVVSAVNEIDMLGQYNEIPGDIGIPVEKLVETTDNLSRNYLAKIKVYWEIPGVPEPKAEIISVTYDYNLSKSDIDKKIQEKLDKYAKEEGVDSATIIKTEILSILHKSGNPY